MLVLLQLFLPCYTYHLFGKQKTRKEEEARLIFLSHNMLRIMVTMISLIAMLQKGTETYMSRNLRQKNWTILC